MSHNWELGQIGEELAATYLMNKGYRILHRNWNLHRGCELDIVAMKDGKLHFVEVKTRSRAYEWKGGRPEVVFEDVVAICEACGHACLILMLQS